MGLRKRQKNQFDLLFQNAPVLTNTSSQAKKRKPEDDSGEQVKCESDNIEEEIRNCIEIDDFRSRCSESISSSQSSKKKATVKQKLDVCYSSSISKVKFFGWKVPVMYFFFI